MCDAEVNLVFQIENIGMLKHKMFVPLRLVHTTILNSNKIPRNSLPTFGNQKSVKEKSIGKLESLKKGTSLVTQIFLSLQSRPDSELSGCLNMKINMSHQHWQIRICVDYGLSLTYLIVLVLQNLHVRMLRILLLTS